MMRLGRVIPALASLLMLGSGTAHAKPYVVKFDMDSGRFFSTCKEGGENIGQVKARHEGAFVTNLSYFSTQNGRGAKPYLLIDLYWRDGVYFKEYRWDWARPVLVISNTGIRIDRQQKGTKWQPRSGDLEAVAIDTYEQPGRRMWRQMIGIRGRTAVLLKAKNATYKEVAYYMRYRLGVSNFASFDGGSSCMPGAAAVTHFCFKEGRTTTRLAVRQSKKEG